MILTFVVQQERVFWEGWSGEGRKQLYITYRLNYFFI